MTSRVTPYEAGWLQMLLDRGLASEKDLRAAQNRVASAAIDALMLRQQQRRQARAEKRRKRKDQ